MRPGVALSDVLPDFGAPALPARVVVEQPAVSPAPHPEEPVIPVFDFEGELERRQARLEERLREETELALAAERKRHDEEIQRLYAELGDNAGRIIVERLDDLEKEIAQLTSQAVARTLGSVLSEDVQARSLAELRKVIGNALADNEAVTIRIQGPLSLFEAVRPALGTRADQVTFVESAGFDLTVMISESIYQTRMAEWAEALTEVLK